MPVDQSNDLLDWRKSHNWTQRQAAEQLGLNTRTYQRIERGEIRLTRRVQRMVELIGRGD